MNNKIVSFEDFLSEAKVTGGRYPEIQLDNLNNGLRLSDVFISTDLYGSKNTMNIKIGMYSGGSNGLQLNMPPKIADLNIKEKEALSSKDKTPEEKYELAKEADIEKSQLIEAVQKEIFDAVTKELEALDKKVSTIVANIIKKY